MPKIVVLKDSPLDADSIARLEKLGELIVYDTLPESYDDWLSKCEDADIICSGKFGLKQRYHKLKNVFISLPFVGVGFFDKEILKNNNIFVSNSPGANKDAVSEWIIYMILNLFREFYDVVNIKDNPGRKPKITRSVFGKKAYILGKGNIGTKVGTVCTALGMDVNFFTRGDNLFESVKDADVVINCLTTNETTLNLLDEKFFFSLKKGSYFVNVCDYVIYDIDALIKALDEGHIAKAAIDAMGIQVGDTDEAFYQKIVKHEKILATPHIAWAADRSAEQGTKIMIDNIEAWLNKKPINLINQNNP